jgi:hypothetical protein
MQIGAQLPTLASPDDIVDRLGRNLNQVEAARIDALLRDGSAIIRRYCRNDFQLKSQATQTFIADAGIIVLPNRPVWSVDSVTWKSGNPQLMMDFLVTWYIFDGIDTITIPSPYQSGIINLPYMWYMTSWYSDSFEVVSTSGYPDVPEEVVAVLCTAIISELSTPTMSATLASESIGPYSYSMRRTSGAGLNAALVDAGMKTTLADFRTDAGTIRMRK